MKIATPMSSCLLRLEEEAQSNNVSGVASPSLDCIRGKERNYLGLSDYSLIHGCAIPIVGNVNNSNLHLKATELRLGLPGSQSPKRDSSSSLLSPRKLDEKPLFPLLRTIDAICSPLQPHVISGNKRGFSDTEKNWVFSSMPTATQADLLKEVPLKGVSLPTLSQNGSADNNKGAPASKAQVVGWPPIRSFRKNSLVSTSKSPNPNDLDNKPGYGSLFVKVSMDGAPYLRKVDLTTYCSYQELSSALEKMFSCFTIGQCGSHGASSKVKLTESRLRDILQGSEYVLTYEDKDGDWMLVGDVPWEMFVRSCKKLKIMKSSDAIGLAPRTAEKP